MLALIGLCSIAALGVLIFSVRAIQQTREGKPGALERCRRLAVADFVLAAVATGFLVFAFDPEAAPVLLIAAAVFGFVGLTARRATARG